MSMLSSLPFDEVKAMGADERTEYFEEYARYFVRPFRPTKPYAIRVGSWTLFSSDTRDLREQFDNLLGNGPQW